MQLINQNKQIVNIGFETGVRTVGKASWWVLLFDRMSCRTRLLYGVEIDVVLLDVQFRPSEFDVDGF